METAKQKWLSAGENVDAARKAWQRSLELSAEDYFSAEAWKAYRAAREIEFEAYQEFLASEGLVNQSSAEVSA